MDNGCIITVVERTHILWCAKLGISFGMLVIFNLASCISLPSAVSGLLDLLLTADSVS